MKTPPIQQRIQTPIQPPVSRPGNAGSGAAKAEAGAGRALSGPLAAAYGSTPTGLAGTGVDRVDRVTLSSATGGAQAKKPGASGKSGERVAGLVAGIVRVPVETQNPVRRAGEAISLHGSAAGRNEAATNIARHAGPGGILDVKG